MLFVVIFVIIRCTIGDTHILGGIPWGSGHEGEALIHVYYPMVPYGVGGAVLPWVALLCRLFVGGRSGSMPQVYRRGLRELRGRDLCIVFGVSIEWGSRREERGSSEVLRAAMFWWELGSGRVCRGPSTSAED